MRRRCCGRSHRKRQGRKLGGGQGRRQDRQVPRPRSRPSCRLLSHGLLLRLSRLPPPRGCLLRPCLFQRRLPACPASKLRHSWLRSRWCSHSRGPLIQPQLPSGSRRELQQQLKTGLEVVLQQAGRQADNRSGVASEK